jgi:hypothetical protein
VIAVVHFHLKYFPRNGSAKVNFGAVFYSEMDALNSAALANATRGREPGYYGVQECTLRNCVKTGAKPSAPKTRTRPEKPRPRIFPRSEW